MIVILIVDPLLIKGSTIGSRTNPSGAIAPSWGIGILHNLSISRGLMPTLFRRTIHEQCSQNIQNAQTTLQQNGEVPPIAVVGWLCGADERSDSKLAGDAWRVQEYLREYGAWWWKEEVFSCQKISWILARWCCEVWLCEIPVMWQELRINRLSCESD
jgi:hypothetical protein